MKQRERKTNEMRSSPELENAMDVSVDLSKLAVTTTKRKNKRRRQSEDPANVTPSPRNETNPTEPVKTPERKRPPPPTMHPEQHTKGKAKAMPPPESPEPESNDSDSDVEFIINIPDRNAPPESTSIGKAQRIMTNFKNPIHEFHHDHQAPFRGILADLKDEPMRAVEEITGLMKGERKKKLLVATTGRDYGTEARHLIIQTIEKITTKKPVEIVPVRKSAFAVVKLQNKNDVEKLIEQKAAYDPVRKMVIIFRRYTRKASKIRAIELCNIKVETDLKEMREYLEKEQGVKMLKVVPEKWSTIYEGRVIWTIEAPKEDWKYPRKVTTVAGTMVLVRDAPVCDICHSDDHHHTECPWHDLIPGAEFKSGGYILRRAHFEN